MSPVEVIAQKRIAAGTVRMTQNGWRVECRDEFNDNRALAEAYWPKENRSSKTGWSCLCRQFANAGGFSGSGCSHIAAVRILDEIRQRIDKALDRSTWVPA